MYGLNLCRGALADMVTPQVENTTATWFHR